MAPGDCRGPLPLTPAKFEKPVKRQAGTVGVTIAKSAMTRMIERNATMTTNAPKLAMPPVVDVDTWHAALKEQSQLEDELMEHIRIVAAARRRMPMTPVQGEYTFVGPDGECTFADLFHGHHQLAVYHFMYAPDWKRGCPHCTSTRAITVPVLMKSSPVAIRVSS